MPLGKKYGGRTAGTPNKKTAEAISRAEKILQLIEDDYFEKDIKEITAAQRIDLYSAMLEYVVPKLSRQEIRGGLNNKTILQVVRTANPNLLTHPAPAATNGVNGSQKI